MKERAAGRHAGHGGLPDELEGPARPRRFRRVAGGPLQVQRVGVDRSGAEPQEAAAGGGLEAAACGGGGAEQRRERGCGVGAGGGGWCGRIDKVLEGAEEAEVGDGGRDGRGDACCGPGGGVFLQRAALLARDRLVCGLVMCLNRVRGRGAGGGSRELGHVCGCL